MNAMTFPRLYLTPPPEFWTKSTTAVHSLAPIAENTNILCHDLPHTHIPLPILITIPYHAPNKVVVPSDVPWTWLDHHRLSLVCVIRDITLIFKLGFFHAITSRCIRVFPTSYINVLFIMIIIINIQATCMLERINSGNRVFLMRSHARPSQDRTTRKIELLEVHKLKMYND